MSQYPPQASYPPPPYRATYQPHRYLALSARMRGRARLAGGASSIFSTIGFWMLLVGAIGILGVSFEWLPEVRGESVGGALQRFAARGGWIFTVLAGGGFLVCVIGTMVGQALLKSAGMVRTTGTAWWSSVLFNTTQVFAFLLGLPLLSVTVGMLIGALLGSWMQLDDSTIVMFVLVGFCLALLVNFVVGWFVSGLLWWWMAHAHRPAMSP